MSDFIQKGLKEDNMPKSDRLMAVLDSKRIDEHPQYRDLQALVNSRSEDKQVVEQELSEAERSLDAARSQSRADDYAASHPLQHRP